MVANGLQEEANVGNVSDSENEVLGNIEVDHEPLGEVASEE